MSSFREGQRVKATKTIQRSSGAAWSGDVGRVTRVTGDGYVVSWDNGAQTDIVKDDEITRA